MDFFVLEIKIQLDLSRMFIGKASFRSLTSKKKWGSFHLLYQLPIELKFNRNFKTVIHPLCSNSRFSFSVISSWILTKLFEGKTIKKRLHCSFRWQNLQLADRKNPWQNCKHFQEFRKFPREWRNLKRPKNLQKFSSQTIRPWCTFITNFSRKNQRRSSNFGERVLFNVWFGSRNMLRKRVSIVQKIHFRWKWGRTINQCNFWPWFS